MRRYRPRMTFYLFAAAFLPGMYLMGWLIGLYFAIDVDDDGGGLENWYGPGPFSDDGGSGIDPRVPVKA